MEVGEVSRDGNMNDVSIWWRHLCILCGSQNERRWFDSCI